MFDSTCICCKDNKQLLVRQLSSQQFCMRLFATKAVSKKLSSLRATFCNIYVDYYLSLHLIVHVRINARKLLLEPSNTYQNSIHKTRIVM